MDTQKPVHAAAHCGFKNKKKYKHIAAIYSKHSYTLSGSKDSWTHSPLENWLS